MQSVRSPSVAYSCEGISGRRSEGERTTNLELGQRELREGLLLCAKAFEDDGVGTFAVELDLAVGPADEGRHAFARTVELEDVEDLVLLFLAEDFDKNRLRLARLRAARGSGETKEAKEERRTVNR